MQPGEQYIVDPKNGVGVRWYCIDPTAPANAGGDIGSYVWSLGEAEYGQVRFGSVLRLTMMAIRRFGEAAWEQNWVGLSNMDFGASGGAENGMCGVRMENFVGQMTARCRTEKPGPPAPMMTVSTLVSRLAMTSIRTLAMNHEYRFGSR